MKSAAIMSGKPTSRQSGIVVIIFVVVLPIILGMMAFALNAGKGFIVKTELQNAVDACALSAGQELDGTSAQFNRAREAGRLAGESHKVGFQKETIAFPNSAVTFGRDLNGSFSAGTVADAATYRYVKCSATSTTKKLLEVPLLFGSDTLTAKAIAGTSPIQSPNVLPIGVCSNADAVKNNIKGAWISGKVGENVACIDNLNCYRWVVYDNNLNASNLAKLLTGNNTEINLATASVSEFSGAAASPYDEYNTRFGVQKSGNPVNPDYTGYGYTPNTYAPAARYSSTNNKFVINAYSNANNGYITKEIALTKYQDVPRLSGYTSIQPTIQNATPRRIGVVPIIPCTGGTSTAVKYACILMLNPISSSGSNNILYLEYLGLASTGACTLNGLAGGGGGGDGPTTVALVQ